MVNLERTCILLSYYFVYLKVNFDLEKNKSAWRIFTQPYFCGGESWPNCFGKEVSWWWILTQRFCGKGEQRWRLELGRFKMPFDACISNMTLNQKIVLCLNTGCLCDVRVLTRWWLRALWPHNTNSAEDWCYGG